MYFEYVFQNFFNYLYLNYYTTQVITGSWCLQKEVFIPDGNADFLHLC